MVSAVVVVTMEVRDISGGGERPQLVGLMFRWHGTRQVHCYSAAPSRTIHGWSNAKGYRKRQQGLTSTVVYTAHAKTGFLACIPLSSFNSDSMALRLL